MKRQIALLTLGALVLVAAVHFLTGRPPLIPADFVAGGADALQFCDPANPRFLAVVAKASPATVTAEPAAPLRAGEPGEVRLRLATATGRPIGRHDLSPAGGPMAVFLADPSLRDFQAALARAGSRPGEWRLNFTPQTGGRYRLFAEFTPAAIGRSLYVSADFPVAAEREPREHFDAPAASNPLKLFARQQTTLSFPGGPESRGTDLVAIDENRSGFVHLTAGSDGQFPVTFYDPGRYLVWHWAEPRSGGMPTPMAVEVRP